MPADAEDLPSAERLKTFTDAVVAIAMTLLILPLMDSVGEVATAHGTAAEWLAGERDALIAFALSFLLIANFWVSHHRLFARIDKLRAGLLWLTIAWMFTIVWLPVATAIVSILPRDSVQTVLYVGGLTLTSLVLLGTHVYVMRHPELHTIDRDSLRVSLAIDISVTAMFAAALVVILLMPQWNYWPMLLLVPAPILGRLLARLTRPKAAHRD